MNLLEPLKNIDYENINKIAGNTDIFIFNQGYTSQMIFLGKMLDKSEMGVYNYKSYTAVLSYIKFLNRHCNSVEEMNNNIKLINQEIKTKMSDKSKVNILTLFEELNIAKGAISHEDINDLNTIILGFEVESGLETSDINRYEYVDALKIPNIMSAQAEKINKEYNEVKKLKRV